MPSLTIFSLMASLMKRFLLIPWLFNNRYKSLSSLRLIAVVEVPAGRPARSLFPPLPFFVISSIDLLFFAKIGIIFVYTEIKKLNVVKLVKFLIKVYTNIKYFLYLCTIKIRHRFNSYRLWQQQLSQPTR